MLKFAEYIVPKATRLRVWTAVGPNEIVKYVLERLIESGKEQPPISAGYSAVEKILANAKMIDFSQLKRMTGYIIIYRFNLEEHRYTPYKIDPKKMQRDSMDGDYFQFGNEWFTVYVTRYFDNNIESIHEYDNPKSPTKYIHSILEPPFIVRDLQEYGIQMSDDFAKYIELQNHNCIHATPLINFINPDSCSGHIADAMANTVRGRGYKFYGNDVFINATDDCISLGDANFTGTTQYTKRIITLDPTLYGQPKERPEYMEVLGKQVEFYSIYIVYKVNMAEVDTNELMAQYSLFIHNPSFFNFRTSSVIDGEYEPDPNRNLGRNLVWASGVGSIAMGFNAAIQSLGKYCRLFNLVELAKYYAVYTKLYDCYQEYPALGKINEQIHIWTDLCDFYKSLLGSRHGNPIKNKNYRATTAVTPDQYFLLFKIYTILANNHVGHRGLIRTYSHLALFEELFSIYLDIPKSNPDKSLLALIFHHTGGFEGKVFNIDQSDLAGHPVIMSLPYVIDNYKPVVTYKNNTENLLIYDYDLRQYSEILDQLGVEPLINPDASYLYNEIHAKAGVTLPQHMLRDFLTKHAQANLNKIIAHEHFGQFEHLEQFRADARPIISSIVTIENPYDKNDTLMYIESETIYEYAGVKYKIDHLTGINYRADNNWLFQFAYNNYETFPQYFYDAKGQHILFTPERDYMCGDSCDLFSNRGIFI